jgi:protein-tyrosine phosphatase
MRGWVSWSDVDSGGTWIVARGRRRPTPEPATRSSRRGYDGRSHRARQVGPAWFDERDLLLVMDEDNLRTMRRLAPDRDRGTSG